MKWSTILLGVGLILFGLVLSFSKKETTVMKRLSSGFLMYIGGGFVVYWGIKGKGFNDR